ncbi:MAG: hypothetical protein Q9174_003884 [Haloplaca sp. 1 TL-2023]
MPSTVARLALLALPSIVYAQQQLTTFTFSINGEETSIVVPMPEMPTTTIFQTLAEATITQTMAFPQSVATQTIVVTAPVDDISSIAEAIPSSYQVEPESVDTPDVLVPVTLNGYTTSLALPSSASVPTGPVTISPIIVAPPAPTIQTAIGSLTSSVAEEVSSAVEDAVSSASSVAEDVSSAIDSASSAASSVVESPTVIIPLASVSATASSLQEEASASASSIAEDASSAVGAASTAASSIAEDASSVLGAASTGASTILDAASTSLAAASTSLAAVPASVSSSLAAESSSLASSASAATSSLPETLIVDTSSFTTSTVSAVTTSTSSAEETTTTQEVESTSEPSAAPTTSSAAAESTSAPPAGAGVGRRVSGTLVMGIVVGVAGLVLV